MKTLAIATLFGLVAGMAQAADLSYLGGSARAEYAVEAEELELSLTNELYLGRTVLFADVVALDTPEYSLTLDHIDFGATHAVTEAVEVFGKVTVDEDLHYTETTVGAELKF